MKTLKIKLFLTAALCAAGFAASAQQPEYQSDPRYGSSPEEREQTVTDMNFFKDEYDNKNYDAALVYLRRLIQVAPMCTENLYIRGNAIYKNKIMRATSLAEKKAYLDTLMMLYDKRAECYGDHAERGKPYILSFKAREYLTYNPADRAEISRLFLKAIEAGGDEPDPEIVNMYFQELTKDYRNDKIESDVLINEYERLLPAFDRPDNRYAEQKSTFEALFINSGVADCANTEKIYRPRIEKNPADTASYEKALALLQKGNCNNDFQIELAEKYYKLKPSSGTALMIAGMLESRKDYNGALKYLNEAIAGETDPATKTNLCIRIAASQLGIGNSRLAADYARQAMAISPDNGYAQLILGQAYLGGINNCQGFDRQAAFWVIYDVMAKARALLAAAGEEEQAKTIDPQLGSFRANFPTKEECFFRNLNPGDGYTVNCGFITGRTSVRER